jgi:hypothetical protein
MKFREVIRRSCYVAVLALFCFGPGAVAQTTLSNLVNTAAVTRTSGVFMLNPIKDDEGDRDRHKKKHVAAPEGGSAALYLLLAGFTCFGAMFLRSRQARTGRPV